MATAGTQRPSIIRWAAGQQCLIQGESDCEQAAKFGVADVACAKQAFSCT